MAASDLSSGVKENMESLLRDGMAKELLVRLHRSLLVGRCTEQTLAERYKEQEMRTPTHFGVGQEAVAVGVCEALNKKDVVYSHHRCHNHYLAKGESVYKLASELYGRETGCSKGEGDLDKDGVIELGELFSYVKPQVERVARLEYNNDQVPQLIGQGDMLKKWVRLADYSKP